MILVIAEQRGGTLSRTSWETIAAAHQLRAATGASADIVVALPGAGVTAAAEALAAADVKEIVTIEDPALEPYTADGYTAALHAGASLAVWTETSEGCLLGADRAGAPRRSSEAIGRFVADALLADLGAGASVDRHAADQLVPFAALAAGASTWVAPHATDHLTTNLWLAERFGARVALRNGRVEVEGVARGAERPRSA